jgi:hypothetical protein
MHCRSMRTVSLAVPLLALLSFVPIAATAAPGVGVSHGDVLDAYSWPGGAFPGGVVVLYGDGGTTKGSFVSIWSWVNSVAEDPSGNIDVLAGDQVRVYSRSGDLLRSFGRPGADATGFAFARNGYTFVATDGIDEYDASGNAVRTFAAGDFGVFDLDLDSDQCTIFYTTTAPRVTAMTSAPRPRCPTWRRFPPLRARTASACCWTGRSSWPP